MRRIIYRVAASLDGYIADPQGGIDWIVHEPTIDFASLYAGIDTVLLGRRTYELTRQPGAPAWPKGWRIFLFSHTLRPTDDPGVTLVQKNSTDLVANLRSESGGDIWLFGGGSLFASLLAADVVDRVELALVPVLLGGGTPLLAHAAARTKLRLTHSEAHPSGIVSLQYDVQRKVRAE